MSSLATLTRIESKVFLREPLAVFWGLVFPSLLLLVLGLVFPGAQEFSDDLGGVRLVDLYDSMDTAIRAAEQNHIADVRSRLENISVNAKALAGAPQLEEHEDQPATEKTKVSAAYRDGHMFSGSRINRY